MTDAPKFFLIETLGDANDPDLCILDNWVEGIARESWRVHKGEPLRPIYPPQARIRLTGEEQGLRLGDLVGNTNSTLIVSTRFRDLIEDACVGVPIEYLPVEIVDHRNRVLSADHHIVNPLGAYDCLDLRKSDIAWDDEKPDRILIVHAMVLDRAKVAEAPQLFRPEHNRSTYVIGRALARAIYDADLSNIMWTELPFGA